MRNKLFWILAVVLVLGVGAVVGVGLITIGARTEIVQAAAILPAENRDAGILVGAVVADSPAAKAGLVRGDIITAVNGTALDAKSANATLLKDAKVGDKLTLTVLHGDDVRSVDVILADQNGKPYLGIVPAFTGRMGFGGWGRMGHYGIQPNVTGSGGARVVEVVAGGPAEKAGIKVGDVILKVNDAALSASNDLAKVFATLKPGDSVKLNVQHKGESAAVELQVTLGDTPDKAGTPYLGIKYLMAPDNNLKQQGQMPNLPKTATGLVVTSVATGSPAEKAGVKVRDIITQVNDKAVTTASDFVSLVKAAKVGDKLTLTITRSGESSALTLDVFLGTNPDQSDQAYLGVGVMEHMRGFPGGGMPNVNPGDRQRGAPSIQGSST